MSESILAYIFISPGICSQLNNKQLTDWFTEWQTNWQIEMIHFHWNSCRNKSRNIDNLTLLDNLGMPGVNHIK